MKFEMKKANMLAEQLNDFIGYVYKNYEQKNIILFNMDKLYQIKLLIEEYKFQIVADELIRINRFDWDPKYTLYLVNQVVEGMNVIEEYTKRNEDDLFMLSGRIETLKSLSAQF